MYAASYHSNSLFYGTTNSARPNRTFLIALILCTLALSSACKKNLPPIISEISQDPANTQAGTTYSFEAKASDEDGDDLSFLWTASGGEFLTAVGEKQVSWRSPDNGSGQSFTIMVSVSDGEFEVRKELGIDLTEPEYGGILGTVHYLNTRIPIEGVIITIGGKETLTDHKGEYSITGLIARNDTLRASLEDFSLKELVVPIPPNQILHYDIELLSVVHSTKLSGKIVDQDGEAISYAEVIVKNPNHSESRLKAVTDENGLFRILYIPHGEREIEVRKEINEDYKYLSVKEKVQFTEIEQRLDLTMDKISLKGSFTDIRDGQEYPFKTIGSQTWMVTNLAYLPDVHEPDNRSESKPRFYVYEYVGKDTAEAKNLEKYRNYGVLYNWQAAQKICPFGWHLPGIGEWQDMFYELYPDIGPKLRSLSGWEDNGNGNNSSGFAAIPGGKLSHDGKFSNMVWAAYFQTSSMLSGVNSYFIRITSGTNYIRPLSENKKASYSVRCIRNN